MDILELLAEEGGSLRLGEVAEGAGLKNNTAHNILRTLSARGYVERGGGAAYRLGETAFRLGRLGGANALLHRADVLMRGFHETYSEATLVLSERIGGAVVVRLRMSPDRPGIVQRPVGMFFHPYATASGLALLAFLPAEEGMRVREHHPFHEHGAHLWESVERLESFLTEARRKGYARPPFRGQEAFRVAAPVMDRWDYASFVFGVSLPAAGDTVDTAALTSAAIAAADELSAAEKQQEE